MAKQNPNPDDDPVPSGLVNHIIEALDKQREADEQQQPDEAQQ
ncbi:hypothetical protein [Actinomadura sp. KC345]|nr:hypothetical protein [Actinomadura sp. KC345]